MAIKVGTRLRLQQGVTAEVVENMDDGQWLQVRYLEVPARPDDVGSVELCHAQDIIRVLGE
ncbi:hypothetical protein J6500_09650 [Bradyrhizobium sp. WSM 1704]|nr:hypothetical protein [Bradyrhizobium semiaridum]